MDINNGEVVINKTVNVKKIAVKAAKYAAIGTGIAVAAYLGASLVRRPEVVNNLHVEGSEKE